MVCVCIVGGGLSFGNVRESLEEAARLYKSGQLQAAADLYRSIIRAAPDEVEALHMLGVLAQQAGNPFLSLQFLEAALQRKPDFARAWFNRGLILRIQGNFGPALQSVRMAIQADQSFAEAWDLCGQLQRDLHSYDESARSHEEAIRLSPNTASFHGNYAQTLLARGEIEAAFCALRVTELLDQSYPLLALGNIYRRLGYPEEAVKRYEKTREDRPDFSEASTNAAMAYLQMGDFDRGWQLWERRADLEQQLHRLPLWTGQQVERLLVYEDQGLGDALQFMRYVSYLKPYATHIILRVAPALLQLCTDSFPELIVIASTDDAPTADMRCRLSSLPAHFCTKLHSIPAPLCFKTSSHRIFGPETLAFTQKPLIGLVWAGNAKFHNDVDRSLSLSQLAPLLACGPRHFISLQKGRPDTANECTRHGIIDGGSLIENFAETASLISTLDLVITVDTATAHLAGSLGKPVFILLPFNADWRWLLGREDSPWYPSVRLFRQKTQGGWSEVVGRVTTTIQEFFKGNLTVLSPESFSGEPLRQNPDALPLPV